MPELGGGSDAAKAMLRRCFYAGAAVALDLALTKAAGDDRAKAYWEGLALEVDEFMSGDRTDFDPLLFPDH